MVEYSGALTASFCGSGSVYARVPVHLCDGSCLHIFVAVSLFVLTQRLFGAHGSPKYLHYSVGVCRSELPSTPVCVCACVHGRECVC